MFNYIGTNNADGVAIYHDGVEMEGNTQKTANTKNKGPGVAVLGRYFVQLEQYFASVMVDELLFFNRYLTPQEVQILYNMFG